MYFGMGISSAWYLQKMYMCAYKHVTESELLIKDWLTVQRNELSSTFPSDGMGNVVSYTEEMPILWPKVA